MIQAIIELLRKENYYGSSEVIEIAKGKHELAVNIKDGMKKLKRAYYAKNSNY